MSCGVGHRLGLDLVLLWLWCRLAAAALIQLLAKDSTGHGPKKKKRKQTLIEGLLYAWHCPRDSFHPPQPGESDPGVSVLQGLETLGTVLPRWLSPAWLSQDVNTRHSDSRACVLSIFLFQRSLIFLSQVMSLPPYSGERTFRCCVMT